MRTDKKKVYEKIKSSKKERSEKYDIIIGLIYLTLIILVVFLIFYFISSQYNIKTLYKDAKIKIIIKNK